MNKLSYFLITLLTLLTFNAHSSVWVTLAWNHNSETNVVGYNLYYGTASRVYSTVRFTTENQTSISNLTEGIAYYFTVTATNNAGLESPYSTEINYTIPLQPTLSIKSSTTPGYISVSWPSTLGVLQYNTDLTTTNWYDYPDTNNPVLVNIYAYNQIFFRLRPTLPPTTIVYPPVSIASISTNTGRSSLTRHVVNNVPTNSLLILTITTESALTDSSTVSFPSLSWSKVADANLASSGDAEIWKALCPNGGNVIITNTWNSPSKACSSVLYVVINSNGNLTNYNVATKQAAPSITLTTTQTNSIIIATSSDWNPSSGTITYRNTPVVQTLKDFVSAKYQTAHWYKNCSVITTYTLGQSAPAGQAAGTCVVEVRSN